MITFPSTALSDLADFLPIAAALFLAGLFPALFTGIAQRLWATASAILVLIAVAVLIALHAIATEPIEGTATWTTLLFYSLIAAGGAAGWAGLAMASKLFHAGPRFHRLWPIAAVGIASICGIALAVKLLDATAKAAAGKTRPATAAEIRLFNSALPSVMTENFSITAADGRFVRYPAHPQPVNNLAAYLFARNLSPALQPGMRVVGTMAAEFKPDLSAILVAATPEADASTHAFQVPGRLNVVYRFGRLPKPKPDEVKTVSAGSDVIAIGSINTRSGALTLETFNTRKAPQ